MIILRLFLFLIFLFSCPRSIAYATDCYHVMYIKGETYTYYSAINTNGYWSIDNKTHCVVQSPSQWFPAGTRLTYYQIKVFMVPEGSTTGYFMNCGAAKGFIRPGPGEEVAEFPVVFPKCDGSEPDLPRNFGSSCADNLELNLRE